MASGILNTEGFDVSAGLQRTMGDRKLYLQLLERFRDDQADAADKIRQALETGDRILAERLAHTLKGVAGLVSATGVQSLADKLEQDIRDGVQMDMLSASLQKIDGDMQALVVALTPVLAASFSMDSFDDIAPNALDRNAVNDLLQQGANLLAQSDVAAVDLLTGKASLLAAALSSDDSAQIAAALRQYDMEGALSALLVGAGKAGYIILSESGDTRS